MLKGGGLVRGTIIESIPTEYVTVQLVTGETRRFPMASVEYAGPAAGAPGRTKAAEAVEPEQPSVGTRTDDGDGPFGEVTFNSVPEHLVLYIHDTSAAHNYRELCTSPCSATVPVGRRVFAVSLPGERPQRAGTIDVTEGVTELTGTFRSRRGLRVGGWVLLGVGQVLGVVMVAAGFAANKVECNDRDYSGSSCTETGTNSGLVFGGVAVSVGTLIAGLVMGLSRDDSVVQVAPGVASFRGNSSALASAADPTLDRHLSRSGLTLQVKF